MCHVILYSCLKSSVIPDISSSPIELKSKKSGLDDACMRLQRDLEKIHIPQVNAEIKLTKTTHFLFF